MRRFWPPVVLAGIAAGGAALALSSPRALAGEVAAPPRTFSVEAAEALVQKLDTMARRAQKKKPPREKTVTVTEGELNSYLNLTLAKKIPKGITDLEVTMERDRLAARALVDLAEVQGKIPAGSMGGLLAFLSGKVPLLARGRVQPTEAGFGAISIEEVQLSTLPIPVSVVEQLIGSATKSAESPEGFDIRSPFRLPYDLKRIRLQPGQALLEY
ncbi:MAG TPA: hypothetical protein VIZ31_10405 [Vicinamibacteria bacterium]